MFDPNLSCTNWTASSGGSACGRITFTSTWSDGAYGGTDFCSKPAPLYCFEQ